MSHTLASRPLDACLYACLLACLLVLLPVTLSSQLIVAKKVWLDWEGDGIVLCVNGRIGFYGGVLCFSCFILVSIQKSATGRLQEHLCGSSACQL